MAGWVVVPVIVTIVIHRIAILVRVPWIVRVVVSVVVVIVAIIRRVIGATRAWVIVTAVSSTDLVIPVTIPIRGSDSRQACRGHLASDGLRLRCVNVLGVG